MFQIISDGGCDFSKEEIQKYNVNVVPFYISFDQGSHLKEGIDITKEDFFQRLVNEKNLYPKTSQPSPQDFVDAFTPYLQEEKDIICLTISSKLSGSNSSAKIAANILEEEYPNRKIAIIDSLNVTIGQGLILKEIAKMRDAGYSFSSAVQSAEKIIDTTKVYFTLDTLEYLKRGGRVGPTTALVGGLLGLRPILHLDDGQVAQLDTVRGKKNALKLIEEGLVEALRDDRQKINLSVGHILSEVDAITLKSNIETSLDIKISDQLTKVGAAIGTHAGPGALAFAYCKKYDAI